MVERLPSKQNVAGSNPAPRSMSHNLVRSDDVPVVWDCLYYNGCNMGDCVSVPYNCMDSHLKLGESMWILWLHLLVFDGHSIIVRDTLIREYQSRTECETAANRMRLADVAIGGWASCKVK